VGVLGLLAAVAALGGALAPAARAGERPDAVNYAGDQEIGIFERLGEKVPLDLTFTDSTGKEVVLGDLLEHPTILTLVYYRCPTICSPLLRELGNTIDKLDMEPGVDFDLVTLSFDVEETTELAAQAKESLLSDRAREVPPDAWHFLTGTPENIEAITEAVGFKFRKEEGKDFVHAGTILFLTTDGKIVRYLNGKNLLPADIKLAVLDAAAGKPRDFFQRLQRLCYAYDPEGQTYVLQVNRLILIVTGTILGLFLLFLLLKRRPRRKADGGDTAPSERAV